MNSRNIKELGKVTYSDLEGKHKENKKKEKSGFNGTRMV